jgi:3-oxoacyl-[acyl-carrier protein] reductase
MQTASTRFSGQIALVSGGSRGIGAAIVRRLASEGALVFFTYARSGKHALALVRAIEAEGGRAVAIAADSADEAAVRGAVQQVIEAAGELHILVSNAGVLLSGHLDTYSMADFDRTVNVNVRAAFVLVQEATRVMKAGGRVVTVGSVTAQRTGSSGSAVYSMSKAAIAALVRGLCHDLAPRGITINNVQPGPTTSDMNPEDSPHRERLLGLLPVGRMGTAEEIASLVAYLASAEAGFITGASLTADGGYLA